MEVEIIKLFGSLVLTFIGFVLPILAILLSLFPEGVKALADKYENEKKQSEDNLIIEEAKKRESGKGLDYKALGKTLKTLKKKKRQAEDKLKYLKPAKFIPMAFAPFLFSLIGVAVILQNTPPITFFVAFTSSALSFFCGVYILWASLSVLIEVTEIIGTIKKEKEEKIIELLSSLAENSGVDKLFIKEKEVQARFNNKYLKKDEIFEFSVNKKYDIPVSINNASDKMAKKIEVGLVFPKDFLIENTPNLSIFTTEKDQIIRFNNEVVQAHENFIQGKIGITFLGVGEYKVHTFIKGENVKYYNFYFKIKVID